MRDLNLLNQAWPNAVFGLRPRLFFLLIPYIHISSYIIGGFMNENDRTTLEQAIYEEMELTPEIIRSIRTLCGVCQTRRGHDYVVMNR